MDGTREIQSWRSIYSLSRSHKEVSATEMLTYVACMYICFTKLLAHAYCQSFYGGINTNDITELFNNVLRKRYPSLRHDTIFALTQVLMEVVFPEQELKYIQATLEFK